MNTDDNANGVKLGDVLRSLAEDNAVDKGLFYRILEAVLHSLGIGAG